MSERKVRLFSFFTVISFLFAFRAWGLFERYHISEFTILMAFILALFTYIKILERINNLGSSNKIITTLKLNRIMSFLRRGNDLTILERNVIFFSVYIPCMLIMYFHSNI
ncbi:hypothetical protein ACP26C_00570 [Franconibacter helveticus 513]|uniref:hypothetical protein n=1 Tax=Enterobacteriaceae TaxID=543 RepID=UPI00040C432E|nr:MULTISPECIES: hypothetical protein [Enterobacteriaceae]